MRAKDVENAPGERIPCVRLWKVETGLAASGACYVTEGEGLALGNFSDRIRPSMKTLTGPVFLCYVFTWPCEGQKYPDMGKSKITPDQDT